MADHNIKDKDEDNRRGVDNSERNIKPSPYPPAALIAVVAASIAFIVLLIPGVLIYPSDRPIQTSVVHPRPNPEAIAFEQKRNQGLREELAQLERDLAGGVCIRDGVYYPRKPAQGASDQSKPAPVANLPTDPSRAKPSEEATTNGFNGNLVDWIDQGVVLVLALSDSGKASRGSGFFVAKDTILTNAHVIPAGAKQVAISGPGLPSSVMKVSVVARTETKAAKGGEDFAILKLKDASNVAVQPYKFAEAGRLNPVIAAGYPGLLTDGEFQSFVKKLRSSGGASPAAIKPVTSQGVINAVRTFGSTRQLAHSANTYPGNSGGPLFDRCGRVVGVNTYLSYHSAKAGTGGSSSPGSAQGSGPVFSTPYAQSAKDAQTFLNANNIAFDVATDVCGGAQQ